MNFSKKKNFNRLATASTFIKFEPKWLDLYNRPAFALSGQYAPSIPLHQVRSSIDSYGRRFVIIGTKAFEHEQQNIVFFEVESKDGHNKDKLFMCYNSDTSGEIRVVYTQTSDEQLDYILQRYAQQIDHRASVADYENAKLLHPSFDF